MVFLGSHLIVAATALFPATLMVTYFLAVCSNHVYPFMPFMSYTGDLPVESCIFSFGVNVTAALYLIIVVLRFNQVSKAMEGDPSIDRMNLSGLEWGVTSALGLSVTASFQQYNAYVIHLSGAATCSYAAFAYFCYQTVLTRKLVGRLNGMEMVYFRGYLCLTNAALLLSAPLLLLYLDLIYSRTHEETICWHHHEEGWHVHLCSSLVEWLMFITNEMYVLSFYQEFQRIRIESDAIHF